MPTDFSRRMMLQVGFGIAAASGLTAIGQTLEKGSRFRATNTGPQRWPPPTLRTIAASLRRKSRNDLNG
jgi:hypothetical protein